MPRRGRPQNIFKEQSYFTRGLLLNMKVSTCFYTSEAMCTRQDRDAEGVGENGIWKGFPLSSRLRDMGSVGKRVPLKRGRKRAVIAELRCNLQ